MKFVIFNSFCSGTTNKERKTGPETHTGEKTYACNYGEKIQGEKIPGEKPPQRKGFRNSDNDHKNNEKFVYLLEINFDFRFDEKFVLLRNYRNSFWEI